MAAKGLIKLCDATAAERCIREWDEEVQERETAETLRERIGGSGGGDGEGGSDDGSEGEVGEGNDVVGGGKNQRRKKVGRGKGTDRGGGGQEMNDDV